jgi:FkbM family methyltransferase
MPTIKQRIRKLIAATTGFEIERLSPASYLVAKHSEADAEQAWYSRRVQLQNVLRRYEVDLVIDVGANEGQFAKSMRRFYDGDIVSFEPVSAVFSKLEQAAANDPRWYVQNLALGSQNARQAINISDQTVFSSLLATNEFCATRFGEGSVGTRQEEVSVRRLDEVLDELAPKVKGRRIFLKLDTQGFDLHVFEGLGAKLGAVMALQSEVSLVSIYAGMAHWTQGIARYERDGFGVVAMFPVTRDAGRVIEFDCLMQRARVEPLAASQAQR